MIRLLSAFILVLWVQVMAVAKKADLVGKVPQWVVPEKFNPDFKVSKVNVSDGWQNILIDQQINVGEQAYFYHYTRKIFSKVGVQNGSEISVNYDPSYEKVHFHFVKVYRNGKEINKLDPGRIKVFQRETDREQFIYNGMLTAVLTLDDVREGDIIDYALTYKGDNPILEGKFNYSFTLQQHDPLDKIAIRLLVPENREIRMKNFGKMRQPEVTVNAQNKIFTWKLKNVPGLSMDDNVPNWFDAYPWVHLSEYRNWQEVNTWALKLFAYPEKKSLPLAQKIDSIKNMNREAGNRISAALDFVQNDIRYLGMEAGISSHKPFAPAQVFAQRFGDCKDKANLLCFMLNEMGINAWPVLVNTQYRQEIKNWLPGSGAFNHCVVQVQNGGKTVWLDPTLTHQTGPYDKVYFPNYGAGLVIKPGTVSLATIPLNTNAKTVINEQFMLDADSAVGYRVETHYFGYESDFQRNFFESNSLQDVEKSYLNYYAEMYPGIRQDKEILTSEDISNNAFMVFENYIISDFWESSEKRKSELSATIYPQVIGGKIVKPATKIRTMPYLLEFPLHIEQTTQVFLPEPWDVETQDLTIEENGLYFSKEVTQEGTTLTIKYIYKTLQPQVEGKNIAAFISTQKKIQDELGYTFTKFGPTVSANPHGSWLEDKNPLFGLFFLIGLGMVAFCCYKMYYHDPLPSDPALAAHPLPVGGWLILPLIGLAVTPFRTLAQLVNADYLSLTNWNNFGDPESLVYSPLMQIVLASEYIFNVLLCGGSVMLFFLFVKRRSNVPLLMVCFYAANAGFSLLETFVLGFAGLIKDNSIYTEVGKAIIGAAIWIPYFLNSKRVKQTFGQTLKPYQYEIPEEEQHAATEPVENKEVIPEPVKAAEEVM